MSPRRHLLPDSGSGRTASSILSSPRTRPRPTFRSEESCSQSADLVMPPILALEKISKRFGAVVVADNIDLLLNEGEALGIIGPNGAGKTSLFGLATGTLKPDSGRVMFAGEDVTSLPPERRCHKGMARSFQIPQPFSGMTVFENVVVDAAFGVGEREAAVYDRCGELLERCGLAEKANKRAGGLPLLDRKRLG